MKKWTNRLDEVSRRDFMSLSALSCLGLGTTPLSFLNNKVSSPLLNNPTAKNVIYLYMSGGMSHLDTFDPKPDNEEVSGNVKAIGTKTDGMQLSEYLPLLAKQSENICLVRSLNSTAGAHAQGNYFMHTSYIQRGTIRHPAMGSWLMKIKGKSNDTLPGNVLIQGGSGHPREGFMESKYGPLPIGNPKEGLQNSTLPRTVDEERFKKRRDLAEKFNKEFLKSHNKKQVRAYSDLYEDAIALMKSEDLKAFDISKEPEMLREAYGNDNFGQGCLLARRLIENDVRFVEVNLGGWDNHNNIYDEDVLPKSAATLDKALSTLLMDLSRRGMLEETLVVVATEFGRTPVFNQNKGRNHFPKAFSCLLAGGGVQGGQVYGETNKSGDEVVDKKITIPDFNATIAYALGLSTDHIEMSSSGRPFKIADKGRPIKDIF